MRVIQTDGCRRDAALLVMRRCSSFEAGKAGIEAWAIRHEARIRDEVARKVWRRSF